MKKQYTNGSSASFVETDTLQEIDLKAATFAMEEIDKQIKVMREALEGPKGVVTQINVMAKILGIVGTVYEKGTGANALFEMGLADKLSKLQNIMFEKANVLNNVQRENREKSRQMIMQIAARAQMGEASSSDFLRYRKEIEETCEKTNKDYNNSEKLFHFTYWEGVNNILKFYSDYSESDHGKVPSVFVVAYGSFLDIIDKKYRKYYSSQNGFEGVVNMYVSANDIVKKLYERKDKWEKQQEIEEYWKEHPEEKKELEERIADLKNELAESRKNYNEIEQKNREQINELEKKKKTVLPEEQELSQLEDLIFDKSREHSKMGIFAGGKKKLLAEEINQLQQKQVELKKNANNAREKYNMEIDSDLRELKSETTKASRKVNQITLEIDSIQKKLERKN